MSFVKPRQVLGQQSVEWPEPDFEPQRSQKPDPQPFVPYGGSEPIRTPTQGEMIRHQVELTHYRWWEKFWSVGPAERRKMLNEAGHAVESMPEDIREACEEPTPPKRGRVSKKKS